MRLHDCASFLSAGVVAPRSFYAAVNAAAFRLRRHRRQLIVLFCGCKLSVAGPSNSLSLPAGRNNERIAQYRAVLHGAIGYLEVTQDFVVVSHRNLGRADSFAP